MTMGISARNQILSYEAAFCGRRGGHGKGGRVLLRAPEEFFHALGDGR